MDSPATGSSPQPLPAPVKAGAGKELPTPALPPVVIGEPSQQAFDLLAHTYMRWLARQEK